VYLEGRVDLRHDLQEFWHPILLGVGHLGLHGDEGLPHFPHLQIQLGYLPRM
jgi:hypothetical protein